MICGLPIILSSILNARGISRGQRVIGSGGQATQHKKARRGEQQERAAHDESEFGNRSRTACPVFTEINLGHLNASIALIQCSSHLRK